VICHIDMIVQNNLIGTYAVYMVVTSCFEGYCNYCNSLLRFTDLLRIFSLLVCIIGLFSFPQTFLRLP